MFLALIKLGLSSFGPIPVTDFSRLGPLDLQQWVSALCSLLYSDVICLSANRCVGQMIIMTGSKNIVNLVTSNSADLKPVKISPSTLLRHVTSGWKGPTTFFMVGLVAMSQLQMASSLGSYQIMVKPFDVMMPRFISLAAAGLHLDDHFLVGAYQEGITFTTGKDRWLLGSV